MCSNPAKLKKTKPVRISSFQYMLCYITQQMLQQEPQQQELQQRLQLF